eukprot:3155985-Prorocentrum_lima.AAC.1
MYFTTGEPAPSVLMFPITSTTGVEKCDCLASHQADPNRRFTGTSTSPEHDVKKRCRSTDRTRT